jgi:hypothetical protein
MIRRLAGVLSLVAVATMAAPAAAELYQWTDANGVRHYTSDLGAIPEPYRPGARDLGSPRPREGSTETRRDRDAGAMRFASGAPIVTGVVINGVALRLILDTGADRTVISPAALARTGLGTAGGRPVRILGVTGSAVGSELMLPEIEVAGSRVGPLRVVVLDLPSDSADGLLGRDVLDYFTLTVDSPAGRATLTPR